MASVAIRKLLEEIATEEGFIDYDIESGQGSNKGDGYTSLTKSVRIISKNENKPKSLNLFIKSASESDELRKCSNMWSAFSREIFIYGTILPIYKDLELKSGLEPSSFGPLMYRGCSEFKCECLILENLRESGFILHECSIPMNDDHVSFVLSKFGRFHALSYALKSKDPDTFSKVSENLDAHVVKFTKDMGYLKNIFVEKCVKLHESLANSNFDPEALRIYKSYVDTIEDEYLNFGTAIDSYAAIIQGDCWTNNMMFKYEAGNSTKPVAVRIFDYQLARIASPVLDLSYFFYTCSSREAIDNWKHYLQLYHKSLSSHLHELGCNADELYPYEVLEDHWRKYARYGFLFTALVIFIMLTKREETINFEEVADRREDVSKAFNYEIAKHDTYLERMEHIVLHFVNNKLFDTY